MLNGHRYIPTHFNSFLKSFDTTGKSVMHVPHSIQKFSNIPGLHLYHNVFDIQMQGQLVKNVLALKRQIVACQQTKTRQSASAQIPQPQVVRSSAHNLAEERSFIPLHIEDVSIDSNGKLKCEHFDVYGSGSHSLTYFQRNRNIPHFAHTSIINPILKRMDETQNVAQDVQKDVDMLVWRMTMNCYDVETDRKSADLPDLRKNPQIETALFPFHVDIAQNGIVTMVVTLGSAGCIQFAASSEAIAASPHSTDFPTEDSPETIILPTGSVLVAAGPSRWEFMHRVLDLASRNGTPKMPRYSLVFGCQ
eukprot:m.282711 g.282711  ORF g.282711 m.282711 type:complete len:306 (+) comp19860_c0_seq2:330-1247(+)